MKAERVGADTLLAQIVKMVSEAQRSRAPIQRLAGRVAAFATAGYLSAGPEVFSILAQDRTTQEVLLDTTVDLKAHPAADLKVPSSTARASYKDSQNKLLQTAELDLPVAGNWVLNLVLRRDSQVAEFSLPLHVVKHEAGIELPWSDAAFVVFTAGLFFSHLRRHLAPKANRSPKCSAVVS